MKTLLSTLAFYLLTTPLFAQPAARELSQAQPAQSPLSEQAVKKIDVALQQRIDDQAAAGIVALILHDGKIVYHKAFGQADIKRNQAMQTDTIFRIYSMSKAITSTAAMMLWEEGKFKLDDPVSQHLPAFRHMKNKDGETPAREMTIRDLFLHTSGLTYGWGGDDISKAYKKADLFNRESTLASAMQQLSEIPLLHDPGTVWNYGVSIDVLGHLVSVWSGMPFEQFLQTRLFDPLDMKDTAFHVTADKKARFASSYGPKLKVEDDAQASKYLIPTSNPSGGGGLLSTSRDYMHFLAMLLNDGELFGQRLLKADTVALMTQNHLPKGLMPIRFGEQMRWGVGHGLGFNVRVRADERWDPPGRVGEYGWGGAASTHYWLSPKDKLAVVTLEQFKPFNFGTELAIKHIIYDALDHK